MEGRKPIRKTSRKTDLNDITLQVHPEAGNTREPGETMPSGLEEIESDDELTCLTTISKGYTSGYFVIRGNVIVDLPEWKVPDLKILIAAKKNEFQSNIRGTQPWRGNQVANFLLAKGVRHPIRDEQSCQEMWRILARDWWDIYDYNRMRPRNSKSYFDMSISERQHNPVLRTPEEFPQELYDDMLKWLPEWSPQDRDRLLESWRDELLSEIDEKLPRRI